MRTSSETSAPAERGRPPPIVAAYYYPGWHPSPDRRIAGDSCEWPLVFGPASGAYDVRRPTGGPRRPTIATLEDEAREANAAGIDAFLWCWYWDEGRLVLNDTLELYLRSSPPPGFRYALAWVTKRPYASLPLDRPPTASDHRAREVTTSEADFEAMIRHLLGGHWSRPDYLLLDGRPLLPIVFVEPLIRDLGPGRLGAMLNAGDALARAAGFPGVHYLAVVYGSHERRRWAHRLGLGRLAGHVPLGPLGFRAVSTYIHLPRWRGPAVQEYAGLVDARAREWRACSGRFGAPFWPSVSPGWDARARGTPMPRPPRRHPWSPVVRGETPDGFARLLGHWRDYARERGGIPLLPVTSWNEWTEGHAVAPCTRHGDGMLRALRGFKDGVLAGG
jgi:hypothetical protein